MEGMKYGIQQQQFQNEALRESQKEADSEEVGEQAAAGVERAGPFHQEPGALGAHE